MVPPWFTWSSIKLLCILPRVCICLFLGAFAKLRKATISFVMSVRPYEITRFPLTDFDEIWYWKLFWKSVEKIQVSLNPTKVTGILHEDIFTFMAISQWILLRMRNVSNKTCRENQNTFYARDFFQKNRAVYGIIPKNVVESHRTQTIGLLRVAYWIRKLTRPQSHAPTPTHELSHTHTHTHTNM